jgi:hypothetical protein
MGQFWGLCFNIFINGLSDVIDHSNCLLFADDRKIYRAINSSSDCFPLHSDIVYINGISKILLSLISIKLVSSLLPGRQIF